MRIQRTTNYPDTSTSSDYPGEKKIQQTRQKRKKTTTADHDTRYNQQRTSRDLNNNGRSGWKKKQNNGRCGYKKTTTDNPGYKEQKRTIRIQKATTTHDPDTKNNNARSGCTKQ